MHKLHWLLLLVLSCCIIFCENSSAISQGVVISEVQLGDVNSAKNEFIELYNNNPSDIEITNWCVYYQSSTLVQSKMTCFTPGSESEHLYLPGHSNIFIVSNELTLLQPALGFDFKFSATLSGTAGYVRILDENDNEVDRLGWGVSTPDSNLATTAPNGKVLSRLALDEVTLLDTDIYGNDFELGDPATLYSYGSIYEKIDICLNIDGIQDLMPDGYESDGLGGCGLIPVDICLNIDGFQVVIPNAFGLDDDGNCQPDVCMNINGIQTVLPENYDQVLYDCVEHDECVNMNGLQYILPEGYYRSSLGVCSLLALPLKITELLPNALGLDDGKEFIELYNPNDLSIDLSGYLIYVGLGFDKFYSFPSGVAIPPRSYMAFSNDDIKFTLLNTSSRVRIEAISGQIIDESDAYINPIEGESWALINDVWKYTNQVTLATMNVDYIPEEVEVITVELKSCATGYYRSSETNRCRKIIDASTELAPCKDGQYRSEETGRCRNIVNDVALLMPCAEGEERNPTTNRCRKVVAVLAGLESCPEGEERNAETNRCRKIAIRSIPQVDYKPDVFKEGNETVTYWSIVSLVFFAVGYGVWEWRWEISRLLKKS